jgi:hypothetical protein
VAARSIEALVMRGFAKRDTPGDSSVELNQSQSSL